MNAIDLNNEETRDIVDREHEKNIQCGPVPFGCYEHAMNIAAGEQAFKIEYPIPFGANLN